MSGILVLAEHDGGAFKKSTFELLGKAAQLAAELGTTVNVGVLGDAPADTLGAYGAATAFVVSGDFSFYCPSQTAGAITAICEAAQPDVVLSAASYVGKDALPRVVARLGGGQGSEVTDLRVDGGKVIGQRPLYAGKVLADVAATDGIAFFTVRANSFGQPTAGSGSATVQAVAAEVGAKLTLVERKAPSNAAVDLGEAEVVVSGGRALGSLEQFDATIRPLASALGAAVGASRAAVDAGYAPHSDQVGQTGKTVNPKLYIAAGISGAIQHLAGMRTSKVIVAINKDSEAPIFEHASYGIVADLFEVVPALAEELKNL